MKFLFQLIWLDMVRYYWTVVYALSTAPGQVTPETPTQVKLYKKALGATLKLELLMAAHSQETR